MLEVDRGVVELGRRELAVDAIPALDVRIGDARTALAALPADAADVVVGDAFGARSVPWHLATAEFVADVRRVLRPDGIYVLNVIDYDPRRLLAAETATLAARFRHVALMIRPDQLAPGRRRQRGAGRVRPAARHGRPGAPGRPPAASPDSVLDDAAPVASPARPRC